jgi:hypothetical protein
MIIELCDCEKTKELDCEHGIVPTFITIAGLHPSQIPVDLESICVVTCLYCNKVLKGISLGEEKETQSA